MKVCRWMLAVAMAAGVLMAADQVRAQTILEEWDTAKAPPAPQAKAVTVDPAKTAVLFLDFNKNSCVPERRARCARVLPQLKKLLTEARAKHATVAHSLSGTTTVADISDEIKPIEGEPVVSAPIDKFFNSDWEKRFKDKGIDTVIVTGTSANGAFMFTVAGAVLRGFKVIAPVDGMPADNAYQEQFVAWNVVNGPNLREATTLTKIDMISFK
jgi:nicotinamidase-related amidase